MIQIVTLAHRITKSIISGQQTREMANHIRKLLDLVFTVLIQSARLARPFLYCLLDHLDVILRTCGGTQKLRLMCTV